MQSPTEPPTTQFQLFGIKKNKKTPQLRRSSGFLFFLWYSTTTSIYCALQLRGADAITTEHCPKNTKTNKFMEKM